MDSKLWEEAGLSENSASSTEEPKQGYFSQFFDNIGAWGKAAYANTRELGMGGDIKDIYDRLNRGQYNSREEYDRLVQELDSLQNERNEYRNMFAENQKILNQNDSAFKDFTEVGGTLQGIGTQAKDTLIGAGVGALGGSVLPGIGTAAGASTGATWGNRIGAIHQAIQDADMNAIDAWERVLQEGGTSEQAEQAYQDAFRNNLPTEAMDIISSMYMGGKITGTAGNILNRVLGKKMAGTVANAAGKVSRFDLPARAGTYVAAKTKNPFIGQAVGVGLSMAENAIEEGIQEPWQDYATERAIDTQRRQYDPNHEGIRDFSVTGEGGLLDYYTTEQGKETALKAAKMGAAFGGVGGLLSHNQFTENGTAHSDSIKAGAQQAKWIEDNKILEDEGNKERYNEIKQTMGQVYDLTEDETENLSVEEVSRMYHEYYTNLYGVGGNRQEQSAVTQADFINAITGEESTRRDIMGEHAEKYINDFGINPGGETLRSMSQLQAEQATQEGQVQEAIAETEEKNEDGQQEGIKAKSAKPGFFNNETKNNQEQNGENKRGYWDLPDKFGKQWERIEEGEQFDYNEEAKFRNNVTGRIANVKRVYDGKSGRGRPKYKYIVQDVTNENEQTQARLKFGKIGEFDSIKKVEKYLNSPYTNKETAFQSNGQVQEEITQALPQEDGVISDKGKGLTEDAQGNQYDNGKLIQSNKAVTIHTMGDLHQYYRDHKDLMSKDLYAEISRQMMRFGIGKADNTEIVLDLTNRESGGFGSKTTTLDANGAIAKAVVRLYAGADLATAAHELAHLGWMNLSQQDRDTFSKWAVATEGKFVAQVLGMQYDQNFRSALIEALTNKGQGGSQASQELWDKIRKEGAVSQTLDILNGTNTEAAIDERFAWEFSNWYAQGYIKGNNPRNIIERILQKACHTLRGALRLLYDTDRYLNKENYNGGEVNDIFSRMSPTRKDTGVRQVQGQPQVELRTEMTQPIQEMAYNPNQGFNETYGETLDTNPNQNISRNTGTIGEQVKPVTPIKTNPNQNINKNTGTVATNKKRNGGNKQSQTYDQSTSKSVTQYKEPPYNGTRELSTQGRVILNNTTAEKLASKIMERYKNAPNMVGAAIQNVFSHVRNEQDQAFAESVLDNVLKQMNSYYGQAVYYDNGVFYGSSSQEEQSQVDNEPIPAEGQKQKNRRKRKNKETTTSTTPVQVAEVVEDKTQEQTNQPEQTSPEVDNQQTQETTQQQPIGNTTEETPTQQQEQQEQTNNAQTQQEEQTEQIEEPIRGKGVSKGALKTGLSRIKNHKFKTDTRAVYYKELLELEEEIFGKVGALSKRQFEDLRWFALDEKDKQFDEAHPELKYPDENIDSKQEEQNKSVENQNLTTDNQNATMEENREVESVAETPATEQQPSTVEEPTVTENETVENAETTEITKTQDSESENITETQNVETQDESQTETQDSTQVQQEDENYNRAKEYVEKKEYIDLEIMKDKLGIPVKEGIDIIKKLEEENIIESDTDIFATRYIVPEDRRSMPEYWAWTKWEDANGRKHVGYMIRHYPTKAAFERDLKGNGYIVYYISTKDNLDRDSEAYNERLQKNRERSRIKSATKRAIAKDRKESEKRLEEYRKQLDKELEGLSEEEKNKKIQERANKAEKRLKEMLENDKKEEQQKLEKFKDRIKNDENFRNNTAIYVKEYSDGRVYAEAYTRDDNGWVGVTPEATITNYNDYDSLYTLYPELLNEEDFIKNDFDDKYKYSPDIYDGEGIAEAMFEDASNSDAKEAKQVLEKQIEKETDKNRIAFYRNVRDKIGSYVKERGYISDDDGYFIRSLVTNDSYGGIDIYNNPKEFIEEVDMVYKRYLQVKQNERKGKKIAKEREKLLERWEEQSSNDTKMQAKGEQNNENTTRGKEEERVRQQTIQEQGRDREVNKKDTGLNGQRGLSRSVQQGTVVLPKTGNNDNGQNNRTDTKFQEAGKGAENQTLLTPKTEEELEKIFWKLIRKKEFHGMDKRWGAGSLDFYKMVSKSRRRHDFNPEYLPNDKAYLTAIKNVNDYIHEHYPQYKNVYRGADGHWRFEFSDKDASFINGFEKLSGKKLETTLGKILKHDNLYKFYPKLQNTPVHLVRNAEMQKFMDAEDMTEKEYFAAYDPETQSIYINSDMLTDGDARNSLLHEIQHAVQDIEGFANGSYSNAYNNDYEYHEGEKQAVLTEKRSNMSEEEIQNNPRYQTLNTEEKTIIEGQNQEYKPVTDTKMQSNGQTSSNLGYIDKQKDIYSVTFTKSAQKNGENQKKMQFYRNNKSYWRENTNQDGSITFTRALPYQQHQKTITYDDINGKTVGKRKKSKAREYYEAVKDQIIKWLFNDKHFLMKAAQHVGALESYMRMMVMKDQGAVAGAAIEDGIVKHNSKTGERTKSLNSIIEAVGEDNQTEFLNYCEAFRILDLAKRGIKQKMTTQEANKIISDVKKSKNAKLFEDQRKNFVEYNHELLWVLVDGGFITEEQYDKFLKVDPNFIPLSKNMEELEGFVDGFRDSKTMINIPMPIHKIGTSMREVKNPFLEMQKRTVEYYVKASRNKAGLIFVNDIANAIAQDAQGDVVAQNQGMVRKLASRDKNGKPISHDSKQNVFYVWNNGEKEYYQVADREIYIALRSFDAEQMGALKKIANATFGFSSRLVRNTATMTPDFGLRNLCRDNLEAFISSEHGFLPFVDSFWGMYQMANDTQWFKEYQSMNGELGTLNRDGEHVATVEHDIRDNVKLWKTYFPLIKKDFRELTDKNRSKAARAKSLLLLATDVTGLHSIYKMNKRMNDYLEIGTRIGEYRNARMGYKGLSGRLFGNNSNTILTNDNDLKRASTSQMYAAYKSKDITLNFGQHGILGKELNRYIPFFNASLQGIYKVGNTLDNMIHGKDARTKQELRFKFLLMAAIGMSAALAGTGDDDYDEAPDYEHDNFWILPNGVRIPKDQLFGRLVGGTIEKATHQYLKDGEVKKLELVQDVLGNFAIDKCTPALIDLGFGIVGNYDTFKGRSVTPEYMAEKLGYLQKDLSTSKLGADISEAMFKVFGVDIGAKKVDFVFSKTLSNLGKYVQSLYELTGHNEKMTRGAEPEDKGGFAETSKELPYPLNSIVGTFATNRNTFQSISDFYDRHKELKKLSSDESIMSKDEKKAWDAYQKAYKEDKKYRDALKAIKLDKSLTGAQKRQKADKIFKQQIKMARKLKDWEKKHGLA